MALRLGGAHSEALPGAQNDDGFAVALQHLVAAPFVVHRMFIRFTQMLVFGALVSGGGSFSGCSLV